MLLHLKTFFRDERSWAVGLVFTSMGFLYGNWATLIPSIKEKFELNDVQLGLLLLCMPFGSTVTNPLAAWLINRFGMRWTTIFGMFFLVFTFASPFLVNNIFVTSVVLVMIGSSEAITNIAMNTCVTNIETHEKINIMSTCHGMFSVGLMFGALVASLLIGLQIDPKFQAIFFSALIFLLAFYVRPIIYQIHEEKTTKKNDKGAKFFLPSGMLLLMILISLCTNITEGVMADWTAVYMREIVRSERYFIGWGFSGYALLMAAGRFLGDGLIPKFGAKKILMIGGIVCVVGVLFAVLLPYTITAVLGFALVGAGVSCSAPILYSSAAKIPNMAKGAGLATMNTFSIAGFLIGPAIIGFISNAYGLQIALCLVALLGISWTLLTTRVKIY